MKHITLILALCLLSCQDRPTTGKADPVDTVSAPAAGDIRELQSRLFHAPQRQEGMAQARQMAPAFTLHSSCEDGLFRLWIVANRDISGNVGSIALTLKAPSELAGSQLASGQGSPRITNYHSTFDPPLRDWWTGAAAVTWMEAGEINKLYGTDLKSKGSYTQIIEGGNGQYTVFREGKAYELLSFSYPMDWPDGVIEVQNGEPGLLEELGATSVPYLSIGATNEI